MEKIVSTLGVDGIIILHALRSRFMIIRSRQDGIMSTQDVLWLIVL